MREIISQVTLSEVILLFILVFMLPMMALLILRLRKYETLFGDLPEEKKKGKKKRKKKDDIPEPAAAAPAVPADVFPYKAKPFMSQSDHKALAAMREAYGGDVEVFPKVALWETVETTDKTPGFAERLHDKCYDFLICDARTGQPLTAVMYNPGKGRPAGRIDDLKKICAAAGANVVFIDMADNYDAAGIKKALGIPELDL
ncbi:MAG: DUF2726 domain-containing protein [Planctomycetaceae bacterium]|nr:DUF2726 domain-containing protein [Planctomycetaceae bacterium]